MSFMDFLRGDDEEIREQRTVKLSRIKSSIEADFVIDNIRSETSDIDAIRQLFRVQSLWVVKGPKTEKYGEMDYTREIEEFRRLKERFADLSLIKLERRRTKYYVFGTGNKIMAFSSPLEMSNNEIAALARRVEEASKKEPAHKAFLKT
jgi:hypothetical protein